MRERVVLGDPDEAALFLPGEFLAIRPAVGGVAQRRKLKNLGVGLTLGYTINENLNLAVGYKSTVNDNGPTDLRMDGFMITLVFSWHPTIEGMRRLRSE
jgi:hypothetical protein